MEPGFRAGEYVLVSRLAYLWRDPVPGDVVVVRHPAREGIFLIKRVASSDGREGIYLLGDNRGQSEDSRHFGAVSRDRLVGKVLAHARP